MSHPAECEAPDNGYTLINLTLTKGITVNLNIKPDSRPNILKARHIPYAIKPKVEAELESLVNRGVMEPVSWSEWATLIVPVTKKDNSVRICGDFEVSINPVLEAEHYPLLCIEDLFTSLAGRHKFSKINLNQAYLQMQVDEKARDAHNSHSQGPPPILQMTLWNNIGSRSFPACDGPDTVRLSWSPVLFG